MCAFVGILPPKINSHYFGIKGTYGITELNALPFTTMDIYFGEMRTPHYPFPDIVDSGHLENLVSDSSVPLGVKTRRTSTKQTQCHLEADHHHAEAFRE